MDLSREQIRSIIYYEWCGQVEAEEIYLRMTQRLGQNIVSKSTINRWIREFKGGRRSIEDEPHTGRLVTVTTAENTDRIRKAIAADPNVTYDELEDILKISRGALNTIIHEHLGLRKINCRFVPHLLTQAQKDLRVKICQENLNMVREKGRRIISKIITGDETYVHYYNPKTRGESKIWVFENETPPTVLKKQRTLGKILYAVFFRSTGLVKAVKLEGQRTVTAKWYTTHCLPKVLEGLSVSGLMLHHDNASSHTSSLTTQFLADNNIKIIPHPPYSPDLAMCDFWLFSGLKRNLRGRSFGSESELDEAVMEYFEGIPEEGWLAAFDMWLDRMERCIQVRGDYFENL